MGRIAICWTIEDAERTVPTVLTAVQKIVQDENQVLENLNYCLGIMQEWRAGSGRPFPIVSEILADRKRR